MGRCASCRKLIVLGGKKQGNLRFCSDDCHQQGFLIPLAQQGAPETVAEQVQAVHQQACPMCGGPGPVDIYTSHSVVSILIVTSWKSTPQLSCVSCGTTAIWKGIAVSAFLGWWGFPFGLIITPLQLLKGARALSNRPEPGQPSVALQDVVRSHIGSSLARAA